MDQYEEDIETKSFELWQSDLAEEAAEEAQEWATFQREIAESYDCF
jgi:hypothetical protein